MHGDVEFKLYGVLPAIGGGVCIGNPIEEVVQGDTPIELTGEDGEPLPIEEALLIQDDCGNTVYALDDSNGEENLILA